MISGEFDFIEKKNQKEYVKKKVIVSPEDIRIVKSQIKDTYGKIMNHEFTKGCGKEDCHWCNFVRNHFVTDLTLEEAEQAD